MQAYFEPEQAVSISMPQPVFKISIAYKKNHVLQINKEFQDIFQQIPTLAFRRNKHLHDLPGCKNIVNNRLQKNSKNRIGFFTKCFSKSGNLCCKKVVY